MMDWTYDILDLKFQNKRTYIHTYTHVQVLNILHRTGKQKFVIVHEANFNPYEINSHETFLLTHIYFCVLNFLNSVRLQGLNFVSFLISTNFKTELSWTWMKIRRKNTGLAVKVTINPAWI